MNQHLNLFRFFNENTSTEFIENNLSRAFALCLTNNSFFLNEYIRSIINETDYSYLFSTVSNDAVYTVDIQIDTATIEKENYKTIYAVAMTSDRSLSMDDFFNQTEYPGKKNITDIFISIKDIAIIIEVKRTGEDCKAQLFNQLLPFIKEKYTVTPKGFSWQDVVKILEKVKHVQQLVNQNSIFINHFLELAELRYPEWFEPKPFNVIPFSSQIGSTNYIQLEKRMSQALAGVSSHGDTYQLLRYNDRISISLPFIWATELVPGFETHSGKEYVTFYIWPGNTKQQGYSIFNKSLDWTKKKWLSIDEVDYELDIAFNVKLSHYMGKYVTGIHFYESDLLKPFHTSDNFYSQSGKWNSDLWKDFEKLMDEHFKPEFKWRESCDWENKFLNTDRSYLFMSLGFEVAVYIPFNKFKALDKKDNDINLVSDFINKIALAFQTLI